MTLSRLDQRGDTLIEVTIALTILAMVLIGAFVTANRAYALGQDSRDRTQLVSEAQQQAEALQSFYDQSTSWDTFEDAIDSARVSSNQGCDAAVMCFHMAFVGGTWQPRGGLATVASTTVSPGTTLGIYGDPIRRLPGTQPYRTTETFNVSYAADAAGSDRLNTGRLQLQLFDLDKSGL